MFYFLRFNCLIETVGLLQGDLVHVKELKVKNVEIKSKIYAFVRMVTFTTFTSACMYVCVCVRARSHAHVCFKCKLINYSLSVNYSDQI